MSASAASDVETKISYDDMVRTGPGTVGGRFLRRFWQPICLSETVKLGKAHREKIMGEYITLYRGESGKVYAVADRCAHRGTQLSVGWVEGEEIRCFYHGWKFAGSGQCVEQPAENSEYAARIKIAGYHAREYLGLVFVYLGEGEPPELPRYPELEDAPGEWDVQARLPVPYNFFQRLENNVDQVHVAFAHRDIFGNHGIAAVPEYAAVETSYGICATGRRPGKEDRITHFHMPNIAVLYVPPGNNEIAWCPLVVWRVPVDDDSNRSINVRKVQRKPGVPPRNPANDRSQEQVDVARAILDGRMELRDIDPKDRALIVPVQDNIAQMGQGVIPDRSQDHLGKSDVGVALVRKLWREELQAIANGRSPRPWLWPQDGVVMTSGASETADA
ncbi:MAG TPA: Rieske 2Fe-2S domain-containing protein [Alphaproteobacteria bacterium]|jgi:5,5'-dehydrodivanillate O-demethylase